MTNYATILETYTFSDILELNDLTEADVLEYLVEKGFVNLPEVLPIYYD